MNALETALAGRAAGLNMHPPRQDGTKAPFAERIPADCHHVDCVDARNRGERYGWKHRVHAPATDAELTRLYERESLTGVGVLLGNGVGMFEFEARAVEAEILDRFLDVASAMRVFELMERLGSGCSWHSPKGGSNLLFRCPTPSKFQVKREDGKVLIEARADGQFAIIPPTDGPVHPDGPYLWGGGGIETVPTIVDAEMVMMHRIACLFGRVERPQEARPARAAVTTQPTTGDRPGDLWNASGDLGSVLRRNGWVLDGVRGDNERWVRPGKNPAEGISATFNTAKRVLYVFSSSVDALEADTGYSPFEALTRLEYGGDHAAAARALRAAGVAA